MTKIETLWQEMEQDSSVKQGLLLRRYSGTIQPDIYLAMKVPEQVRGISASFSPKNIISISSFANLRDIRVEVRTSDAGDENQLLLITLLNVQHKDIFSVLCEDLILSVSTITNQKQLLKKLLNRLLQWQALLDKASAAGLSSEEQRGLFGELHFLQKLLNFYPDRYFECVSCWYGPQGESKDFQHGNWGVEVKTTHGNNHQKVHISSERQLDKTGLNHLWLYHLSLQEMHHSGQNLNQLIDNTLNILNSDFSAISLFQNKLLEGGYFQHHAPLYEEGGYHIRSEAFYEVKDAFPRIEEADIREGVGDVAYTIILSQCSAYLSDKQEVLTKTNPA